jgi:hypothetical protein
MDQKEYDSIKSEVDALHEQEDIHMECARSICRNAANSLRLLGTLPLVRMADEIERLPDSRDWQVQ